VRDGRAAFQRILVEVMMSAGNRVDPTDDAKGSVIFD